jgi:hypothetical protein
MSLRYLQGIQKDPDLRAFWTYCQQHPLLPPKQQQQQQQQQQVPGGDAQAPACAGGADEPDAFQSEVVLPLTALAHSKHVNNWFKQQQQRQQQQRSIPADGTGGDSIQHDMLHDIPAKMRLLRNLLQRQAADGKLPPGESPFI